MKTHMLERVRANDKRAYAPNPRPWLLEAVDRKEQVVEYHAFQYTPTKAGPAPCALLTPEPAPLLAARWYSGGVMAVGPCNTVVRVRPPRRVVRASALVRPARGAPWLAAWGGTLHIKPR